MKRSLRSIIFVFLHDWDAALWCYRCSTGGYASPSCTCCSDLSLPWNCGQFRCTRCHDRHKYRPDHVERQSWSESRLFLYWISISLHWRSRNRDRDDTRCRCCGCASPNRRNERVYVCDCTSLHDHFPTYHRYRRHDPHSRGILFPIFSWE